VLYKFAFFTFYLPNISEIEQYVAE